MYSTDLAYVHDAGFDDVAAHAAPEIARTLRAAGIRDGHVVEVGCGSGTVARHLLSRGYQVTGLDISPAMIRLGRAKAPDARFRVASLTTARIPPCDAVVALGEVITYVPGGIAAIHRFFHRVFTALAPGGLLLFDFIGIGGAPDLFGEVPRRPRLGNRIDSHLRSFAPDSYAADGDHPSDRRAPSTA